MKHQTKHVSHVHVALINLRLVKLNVQNVRTSRDVQALPLDQVLVQPVTAKNDAQLANISIRKLVCVALAVMDSSSPTKDRSTVTFADLDKPPDQQKLNLEMNAVTSALQECNLELMANANSVPEEHTVLKAYSPLVTLAHSEEQHQRLDQQLLKNVLCPFVRQERILMPQSTFVLSAAKAITNQNHSKHPVFSAHQITAQRTLPPLRRPNVQIHVKLPLRDTSIVIPTLTVFLFLRPRTLNVNASLDLMALVHIV